MQVNRSVAKHIFSLIDLTSLNDQDDEVVINSLCKKAVTQHEHVAAICIYPQFVQYAAQLLIGKSVKIATVANFPFGIDALDQVIESIHFSLKKGADEIDVVFPYQKYLAGEKQFAQDFVSACKKACGEKILKVILETGALKELNFIAEVSELALRAGADFIKTSTGKISVGATLEAAEVMLLAIKQLSVELNRPLGFKASGGVRSPQQAMQYIDLASRIMGTNWVTPMHFRLGASQLAEALTLSF